MNANTLARIVIVFAAGLAAAAGAEAKRSSMSVGLTIVPSCAVSGDSLYRAASSNVALAAGSNATMVAACSSETSYTVALSSVAKVEAIASSRTELQAGSNGAQGEAGYVVMTLTY